MVKYGLMKLNDGNTASYVFHHDNDAFVYQTEMNAHIVSIKVISYKALHDAFHDLSFITERLIKKYHPDKILISCDKGLIPVLHQCGYYQKGTYYQKIIDPYRKLLKDSIFDDEGYIIDQGNMECVPFGWFNTKDKGCGWIAAYNLLKMNGINIDIEVLIRDLEKFNFLGKVFGENLFWLAMYLNKKIGNIHISLPGYSSCLKALQKCDSGILAYTHSKGAHYATFQRLDMSSVIFYNAIYKKRNHIVKLYEFMKQYSLFHGCLMIWHEDRGEYD